MPVNKDKYYKIDSKNWIDNPAVRRCSCLARSLYMDCLCYMHSNKTGGYLSNIDDLSSIFKLSKQYIDAGLRELIECGLLKQDIESGLLYNSDFRKKSRYSRQQKAFGSRGGNPNLSSDENRINAKRVIPHGKNAMKNDCKNAKRVNPNCENATETNRINAKRDNPNCKIASNKDCKLAKRDNPFCKVATGNDCRNAKRDNPIRKNAPDVGITLFANMRQNQELKNTDKKDCKANNSKDLGDKNTNCKNATRDNPFCKDANNPNIYSYNYTNNYIENNRSSSSYSNRDCLLVSKDDETQKQKTTTTTFDLIEIFDRVFVEVWGNELSAKLRSAPRSTDKTYAAKYIKAGLDLELAREIFLEKQQKRKNSNQKPIDSLAYFRAVVPEVINRIDNINNQNFELTTRSDSYATGNKNFTSSKTSNYTSKFDQRAEGVFEEISRRRKPVSD